MVEPQAKHQRVDSPSGSPSGRLFSPHFAGNINRTEFETDDYVWEEDIYNQMEDYDFDDEDMDFDLDGEPDEGKPPELSPEELQ